MNKTKEGFASHSLAVSLESQQQQAGGGGGLEESGREVGESAEDKEKWRTS